MRQGPLLYLRTQLGGTNFMAEWKLLTPKDQADLRQWADEEMDALDIPRT